MTGGKCFSGQGNRFPQGVRGHGGRHGTEQRHRKVFPAAAFKGGDSSCRPALCDQVAQAWEALQALTSWGVAQDHDTVPGLP